MSQFDTVRDHSGTPNEHAQRTWLDNAVNYRVDARTFRDSDGDGIGDIGGIRERLGYLHLLGVDNLWLTGILAAPAAEAHSGREVDPVLGDLGSFDKLTADAHDRGMHITMDLAIERSSIGQPGFADELARILRFWIDRDVDGFRFGTTPGMTQPVDETVDGLLDVLRPVADEYSQCLLGAFVDERFSRTPGSGRLDLGVDARFSSMSFDAAIVRGTVENILAGFASVGTRPGWALAGWGRPRPAGQHGEGSTGLARGRAMALVQLALPGVAGLDNGDELGLAESETSERVAGQPARSPMPWTRSGPTFGFTEASSVPPTPQDWQHLSAEAQLEDPSSTLSLYRTAINIRHTYSAFREAGVEWYGAPPGCLAFRRGDRGITCALNTTRKPVPLPPGEVLLTSSPFVGDHLPADAAAWLV